MNFTLRHTFGSNLITPTFISKSPTKLTILLCNSVRIKIIWEQLHSDSKAVTNHQNITYFCATSSSSHLTLQVLMKIRQLFGTIRYILHYYCSTITYLSFILTHQRFQIHIRWIHFARVRIKQP